MADHHPYRTDPDRDLSDADDDPEEQVVFDISGRGVPENLFTEQEKTYYLQGGTQNTEASCGFFGLTFPSLRRYATLKMFIVILTVLCCFQGMFYAFWISIITSLEKQYELSSSQIGFVTSVGEIGRICTFLGLSFYGELRHRPRWIAVSSLITIVAYILLEVPGMAAPESTWSELLQTEVCRPNISSNSNSTLLMTKCDKSEARFAWRTTAMIIFTLSHFLSGCASVIPLAYGISLIQDHLTKKDSALYLGIYFLSKVLGPVFGFLLGAFSTAMMVNRPGLPSFTEQDPRWLNVRAWHVTMGILLIGFLNFVVAIAMLLFPSEFPMVDNDNQGFVKSSQHIKLPIGAYKRPLTSRLLNPFIVVKEDVKKLLSNQIFMTRVVTVIINVFVLSGFYVFLPKYLEAQFYVQPNAANVATAIAILLPTGCGILVGCFIYRYCDLKPKHTTLITMTTSLIFFVGFLLLISFRCDTRKLAGDRTPEGLYEIGTSCNQDCNCRDEVFSPVCDVSAPGGALNYFSSCRAGCKGPSSTNSTPPTYENCECATSTTLERIPAGFCRISCNKFWPYIFLLFLILFVCSIPTVGSVMLVYRTVPGDLMLMAHLLMAICVCLFALFPSPIIFGSMIDSSCVLWSTQGCSSYGACLIHDNADLAFRVSGTISGMKILVLLIEVYMFWKSRNLEFDDIEPAIMWSPEAVRLAFTETVGR